MPETNSPILVTGGHRTGTTWVGKMLAAGGQAAYISEPLNVLHRPGVFAAPVDRWYTYICAENEAAYLPAMRRTIGLRYGLFAELGALRSTHDLMRMGRDMGIFSLGRLRRQRALLKDPFAIFSIPWFIQRFDCQVVVTVRHPAAFASSLKRLGWPFQMEDLLAQPLLMRDWLEPFRPEMEQIPAADLPGAGSLLWKMIYTVVADIQQRHPGQVHTVRHEDLSLDPLAGYGKLYARLGLDFSHKARQAIIASSSSDNPGEVSTQSVHSTRLDSRANLHNWKRRLQPEDLARIRQVAGEAVERYYPDTGWE